MTRKGFVATALTLLLIVTSNSAIATTAKAGNSCTKINSFQTSGSTLLVCAAKNGKRTWRKATSVEKALYQKEKARLEKAAAQKISTLKRRPSLPSDQ